MNKIHTIVSTFVLVLLSSASAFAGIYDDLTAAQKTAVQNGEQVFVSQDVDGSDWPRAVAYQRVAATPEETAAVFFDADKHKDYITGIKRSEIVSRASRTDINVTYRMDLGFPFGTETYTVRTKTATYDAGQSYKSEWVMVNAETCKSIEGKMRLERLGTGTILAFNSFIKPGKPGAAAAKGKAMQRVREFADSVKTRTESLKASNPTLLQAEIAALRAALGR